jgi:N-acetylglucosamine-6-phosphate deacetylase
VSPGPSPARKGFVDLQVNGYLGVDLVSPQLQTSDVRRLTEALVADGTVGYCATMITSGMDVYERNLKVLAAAAEEPGIRGHLLGIHLEGPYLSRDNGARGAHAAEKMRRPDSEEFDRLQEWADGHIVLLTVAPEIEGALRLIEHVRRRHKTVVSLGHHLASREMIARAADAGATMATHLGNGCPNQLHRHDNIIVHQLVHDGLVAGIITDGNHLPEDFVRLVFRCKGTQRIFVVSDSAPIAGYPPGIYQTMDLTVRLTANGRIENVHAPHFVGSGYNMAQCMRWLRSLDILSEDDLWKVGLENPLRFIGADLPRKEISHLPEFAF